MDLNGFIGNFGDQIEDLSESLNENTVFKQLKEWDSLNTLAVIAMIDKVYNKQITGDQIENASTIKDLFEIVKNS